MGKYVTFSSCKTSSFTLLWRYSLDVMENRYKLPRGVQRRYLLQVEKISGLSGDKLAELFGIVDRSYRDWRREKYSITEEAVNIIEKKWRLCLPFSKNQAKRNWIRNKLEL